MSPTMTRPSAKTRSGFSIVELLLVVAVIGILAAISAPNYQRWRAATVTNEAAQQLGRDLERLRTEVKRLNTAKAASLTAGTSYQWDGRTISLPPGVEIFRLTNNGTAISDAQLTFNPPYATLSNVRRHTFELRWIANPQITRTVTIVGVTGKVIFQ